MHNIAMYTDVKVRIILKMHFDIDFLSCVELHIPTFVFSFLTQRVTSKYYIDCYTMTFVLNSYAHLFPSLNFDYKIFFIKCNDIYVMYAFRKLGYAEFFYYSAFVTKVISRF